MLPEMARDILAGDLIRPDTLPVKSDGVW